MEEVSDPYAQATDQILKARNDLGSKQELSVREITERCEVYELLVLQGVHISVSGGPVLRTTVSYKNSTRIMSDYPLGDSDLKYDERLDSIRLRTLSMAFNLEGKECGVLVAERSPSPATPAPPEPEKPPEQPEPQPAPTAAPGSPEDVMNRAIGALALVERSDFNGMMTLVDGIGKNKDAFGCTDDWMSILATARHKAESFSETEQVVLLATVDNYTKPYMEALLSNSE